MNKPTKNAARLAVGTVLAASAFTLASFPAQAATPSPVPVAEHSAAAPSNGNALANGGILNGFLAGGLLNGGVINGPLVGGDVLGPLQLGQFQ